MADQPDDDDKTEEPTPKKLADARNRGDVIYSSEVSTALSLAAATLALAMLAGPLAQGLSTGFLGFLAQPHAFSPDPGALRQMLLVILIKLGGLLGMVMLVFTLAGIASRFIQDQPAFSAERLAPKLDRLSPIEGFKRVFGPEAMGQFLKGLAKLAIVGVAVAVALWPEDGTLEQLALMDIAALLPFVQERAVSLMLWALVAVVVIAVIDYVATRQSFMKRMRMTRTELKDEFRQSEGDPQVRMKLRQLRMERANKRMLSQVPTASVVVTNPTHFAVALRYDPATTPAPICVAKGVDEVARRIREAAEAAGVPLMEDPPLARALFATAELDQPIPRAHYEAVARIIGLVLGLAQRRGATGRGPNRGQ